MTYGSILVLALSVLSQVSEKPEVTYDKFDDYTVIASDLKELPGEEGYSNITLITNHKGKDAKRFKGSDHVSLYFDRTGKAWKYLSHHNVAVMCGDEHVPVMSPGYSSKTDHGECNESMHVRLTLNTLKKFLEKDQDWDIKLGWEEPFSLDARDRAKMKAFVKFLEEGGG